MLNSQKAPIEKICFAWAFVLYVSRARTDEPIKMKSSAKTLFDMSLRPTYHFPPSFSQYAFLSPYFQESLTVAAAAYPADHMRHYCSGGARGIRKSIRARGRDEGEPAKTAASVCPCVSGSKQAYLTAIPPLARSTCTASRLQLGWLAGCASPHLENVCLRKSPEVGRKAGRKNKLSFRKVPLRTGCQK